MFSLPYDVSRSPPAPILEVVVRSAQNPNAVERVRLVVDTGADQTVLPANVVQRLGVPRKNAVAVGGFGGGALVVWMYDVEMSVFGAPPANVTVLASSANTHYVLGRDVLNRYRIVLDGPNQTLEIA